MSADLAKTYDQIVALAKTANPQGPIRSPHSRERSASDSGWTSATTCCAPGPKLAIYAQASRAVAAGNPATAWLAQFTGLTLSVQVRDQAAVAKVLDPLMNGINGIIAQRQAAGRPGPAMPVPRHLALRKHHGPRPTYVLDLPPGPLPPQFSAMFQPTVIAWKDQLVLGAHRPPSREQASAGGPRWQATGGIRPRGRRFLQPGVLEHQRSPRLDARPHRELPALLQQMNAMMLPAVQSAREAARRAQCTNNLKQIALAMHNYHDVNNSFPKPAITDKEGKPLLSWRVAILPYIEQSPLYKSSSSTSPGTARTTRRS